MVARALLVQLSDPHLRASDERRTRQFAAVVERVAELAPAPVAVIVTGDLTDLGEPTSYEAARTVLAKLDLPVHVIPGNHDDRRAMREAFGSHGSGDDPIRFSIQAGPLRVVAADTVIPGSTEGRLDLAWLAEQLDADRATPTVVALHHLPLATGFRAMDRVGIPAEVLDDLERLLGRSPQVLAVIAGHVHRSTYATLGGVPVVGAPSTDAQLDLDFVDDSAWVVGDDPPAFVVHALVGDRIVSHVQPVDRVT